MLNEVVISIILIIAWICGYHGSVVFLSHSPSSVAYGIIIGWSAVFYLSSRICKTAIPALFMFICYSVFSWTSIAFGWGGTMFGLEGEGYVDFTLLSSIQSLAFSSPVILDRVLFKVIFQWIPHNH